MIAFCIALLVAGSNAAEHESQKTAYFRVKNIKHGLTKEKLSKVVKSETSVKIQETTTANEPFVDNAARGYLMEWTRVNTDCSGRVEFVGGILSGSTNPITLGSDTGPTLGSVSVDGKADDSSYSLAVYHSNSPDGQSGVQVQSLSSTVQCTRDISETIPFDGNLVYDHKGYFFGHTLLRGDYSAVTASLKGLYIESYTTKNECILGVQPLMFAVPFVKDECYFDSNTLLMEGPDIKHDWFKVVGFGKDFMEFSIHNNAQCENKEAPYKTSPVQKSSAPPEAFECSKESDGFWTKYKTYN